MAYVKLMAIFELLQIELINIFSNNAQIKLMKSTEMGLNGSIISTVLFDLIRRVLPKGKTKSKAIDRVIQNRRNYRTSFVSNVVVV